AVDAGDLRGQAADLAGAGQQAVVDLRIQRGDVAVELAEAGGQGVGLGQHVLALGGGGGVGGQRADRVEEVGPGAGEVGGAVGKQRVQARSQGGKLLQARQFTTAVEQARGRQLVGHAPDVGDLGAAAD